MPTLNDARMYTRAFLFAEGLSLGVIIGVLVAVLNASPSPTTFFVVLLTGLLLQVGTSIAVAWASRHADAVIRAETGMCTRDLTEGRVPLSSPVPARVVRSRSARTRTGGVVDLHGQPPGSLETGGRIVVMSALPDAGPARRVAVLAPRRVTATLTRGSIHLVHLHPDQPEAAVLNVRAEPGRLEAAGNDPRWATSNVPTDGSVAGGWPAAAGFLLLGIVVGLLAGLAVAGLG
ncbi:MAG: hypothetical protein ACR2K2_10035 [Mycobacteriales bacterium]